MQRDIKDLIDGLVPEECGVTHQYCVLKLIAAAQFKRNPRELLQIKCVEMFKWDINKASLEELDISDVWMQWAECGCAKAFKEVYDENGPDIPVKEIYKLVQLRRNEIG